MKYLKIKVSDDFEKGCCIDCPISYLDHESPDWDFLCPLYYLYDECGLEIVEEN
jgi:hypothetical protein